MSARRRSCNALGLAMLLAELGLTAGGGAAAAQPVTVSPSALHACAIISADAERLTCYDRLSGRAQDTGTPASAAAATTPAGPAPAAPEHAPAAVATAPPPPPGSFGLYAAEHPAPPPVSSSLEARVSALGEDAGGHMTVSLEDGALWVLDEADPLIAVGQTVTITRAALGSFLMKTASRRTHRVRRLH